MEMGDEVRSDADEKNVVRRQKIRRKKGGEQGEDKAGKKEEV